LIQYPGGFSVARYGESRREERESPTISVQLKCHAFCFKLSFRFKPVLDIVPLCPSSSKEQFVCSSRNVIFSYYTVMFCDNELDGFCLSLCSSHSISPPQHLALVAVIDRLRCSFTDSWEDERVKIGPFRVSTDKLTIPELPNCGQITLDCRYPPLGSRRLFRDHRLGLSACVRGVMC
jgi:hypothetical protein